MVACFIGARRARTRTVGYGSYFPECTFDSMCLLNLQHDHLAVKKLVAVVPISGMACRCEAPVAAHRAQALQQPEPTRCSAEEDLLRRRCRRMGHAMENYSYQQCTNALLRCPDRHHLANVRPLRTALCVKPNRFSCRSGARVGRIDQMNGLD